MTDDPIRIGTMLYTLVEPHRGHEVAYNRWYERDHFYAGCQIGAYNFAGARFVATAPLKALRLPPAASDGPEPLVADPQVGSYLGVYYVLDGHHDEWNRWAVDQVNVLHAAGRMFERARPHPHRPLPLRVGAPPRRRTGSRPSSPSTTGSRGWSRSSSSRPTGSTPDQIGDLVPPRVPALGAARTRPWPPCWPSAPCRCWPTPPATCPAPSRLDRRVLLLWFLDDEPAGSWDAVFAGQEAAVAGAGLGRVLWASPFIGTVPGTDTYTDQLWSTRRDGATSSSELGASGPRPAAGSGRPPCGG